MHSGGQILANTTAWTEVQRSQLTPCTHNDIGRHKVDGCEKRLRLIEVSQRKSIKIALMII